MWKIKLRYLEMQTEGPVFEQMEMQLMAIISMMKIKVGLVLKAALICKIEAIEVVYEGE
jgi:hypothetical protein